MKAIQSFEKLRTTLAADIKRLRVRAGLSQEELALASNVDRTYVSQIERRAANPSLQVLFRLADTLGAELTVTLRIRELPESQPQDDA